MGTLVDLLEVLGRRPSLPLAAACSSRDVLDALVTATSSVPFLSVSFLSDEAESERAAVLDTFRGTVAAWNDLTAERKGNSQHSSDEELLACLLVATDACLPNQQLGEASLGARLLINYDIPAKKEAYLRRISACLGNSGATKALSSSHGSHNAGNTAGGIVINLVVAGEAAALRYMEEACGIVMDEMPIHISEML